MRVIGAKAVSACVSGSQHTQAVSYMSIYETPLKEMHDPEIND